MMIVLSDHITERHEKMPGLTGGGGKQKRTTNRVSFRNFHKGGHSPHKWNLASSSSSTIR